MITTENSARILSANISICDYDFHANEHYYTVFDTKFNKIKG